MTCKQYASFSAKRRNKKHSYVLWCLPPSKIRSMWCVHWQLVYVFSPGFVSLVDFSLIEQIYFLIYLQSQQALKAFKHTFPVQIHQMAIKNLNNLCNLHHCLWFTPSTSRTKTLLHTKFILISRIQNTFKCNFMKTVHGCNLFPQCMHCDSHGQGALALSFSHFMVKVYWWFRMFPSHFMETHITNLLHESPLFCLNLLKGIIYMPLSSRNGNILLGIWYVCINKDKTIKGLLDENSDTKLALSLKLDANLFLLDGEIYFLLSFSESASLTLGLALLLGIFFRYFLLGFFCFYQEYFTKRHSKIICLGYVATRATCMRLTCMLVASYSFINLNDAFPKNTMELQIQTFRSWQSTLYWPLKIIKQKQGMSWR